MGSAREKFTGYLVDIFNIQREKGGKEGAKQREMGKGREEESESRRSMNRTGTRFQSLQCSRGSGVR